ALADGLDVHAQPLLWDYVKAKLRLGEGGRKPIRPVKLDLAAAPLPKVEAEPPSPAKQSPPRDGSRPRSPPRSSSPSRSSAPRRRRRCRSPRAPRRASRRPTCPKR